MELKKLSKMFLAIIVLGSLSACCCNQNKPSPGPMTINIPLLVPIGNVSAGYNVNANEYVIANYYLYEASGQILVPNINDVGFQRYYGPGDTVQGTIVTQSQGSNPQQIQQQWNLEGGVVFGVRNIPTSH